MSAYFLQSSRLGFRPWKEEDIPLALELWGNPEVTKHIDGRVSLSDEDVLEKLIEAVATQEKHGVQYWPIFLLENDEHVGCGGLRPYKDSAEVLEIGIHICVNHWRRGYATEAAQCVIKHAFETLQIKAIFAGHNPKNLASRNLLKKLGFRYTHDEYFAPTGLHHPSYLMTKEEYEARVSE